MATNRIVKYEILPAKKLIPHPENWRLHTDYQKSVLRSAIDQVGWVDAVKVVAVDGGKYMIIDGHLRAEMGEEIPCLVVDLSEDEMRFALATLDPIASLAESDGERLREIISSIRTESDSISQLLSSLIERSNAEISTLDITYDNGKGDLPGGVEGSKMYDITIRIPESDLTKARDQISKICAESGWGMKARQV